MIECKVDAPIRYGKDDITDNIPVQRRKDQKEQRGQLTLPIRSGYPNDEDIDGKDVRDNGDVVEAAPKMRSQPPGVMSLHDAVTLSPTKADENKLSPSSSPVSTSQPDISLDCQNLSPTSKCSDWKQKNESTLSNSNQASVIESNNKNRLKSMKAKTAAIESVTPSNGMSSQIVMQDVLSIKSYLHKLSRILQAEDA